MTQPTKAHTHQPAHTTQKPVDGQHLIIDIIAYPLTLILVVFGIWVGWKRLWASMGYRTVRYED